MPDIAPLPFRLYLLLFLCVLPRSSGATLAAQHSPIPKEKLLQALRNYSSNTPPAAQYPPTISPASLETEDDYSEHIRALLDDQKFDALEAEARSIRANQFRLVGGVWKLYVFYADLASSHTPDEAACEAALENVTLWIDAHPRSATAHIALASLYLQYAYAARGQGYAHTVSPSSWKLFGQRLELAKAALLEAASLPEKCPHWFETMQLLALYDGWEKSLARELFERAVAFEPAYYHFYREYGNYLLPKWYGEDGELQAFVNEVSARNPEPFGSILYFEIATLRACQCDPHPDSLDDLSWPKIQQGYASLKLLYGLSPLKMNRFAFLAYVARDKSAAQDAFASLGYNWEPRVWNSSDNFLAARTWATSPSASLDEVRK